MKLSYVQRGEGKDLVMLHGYLASKESLAPLVDYFSRHFRVTALDFPGMGEAGPLAFAWSVDDYADWTGEVLSFLGISFPHALTHSFGGRVAVKLLSRGDIFDRAVLAGCAGILPKRGIKYRFRVAAYRGVRRVFPKFAERHFGSEEYRSLSPVMRESFKRIVNEDLRQDAARIRRPVLFLNGALDRATPPSSAEVYHAAVKGSRLVVLEGCGHFAYLDDPLSFTLAAEEFFYARS